VSYRRITLNWKLNSVALVRKRIIPTERPPLVGDVKFQLLRIEGVVWSAQRVPTAVDLGFLKPEPLLFYSNSPRLYSRGSVDPVPDPILLRKSGRARNRIRDLWICSQVLWPLDHRSGRRIKLWNNIYQGRDKETKKKSNNENIHHKTNKTDV
jgi:hypothetical protein